MIEPQIKRYERWLQQHRGLQFDSYDALWRWSVSDLEAFWGSIWDFFDIQSPVAPGRVLADPLPGGHAPAQLVHQLPVDRLGRAGVDLEAEGGVHMN